MKTAYAYALLHNGIQKSHPHPISFEKCQMCLEKALKSANIATFRV